MKESNRKSDISNSDQVKIMPLGNGTFEVHFDFSPIPVKMNEGFLNSIIKEINPDYLIQKSVG